MNVYKIQFEDKDCFEMNILASNFESAFNKAQEIAKLRKTLVSDINYICYIHESDD